MANTTASDRPATATPPRYDPAVDGDIVPFDRSAKGQHVKGQSLARLKQLADFLDTHGDRKSKDFQPAKNNLEVFTSRIRQGVDGVASTQMAHFYRDTANRIEAIGEALDNSLLPTAASAEILQEMGLAMGGSCFDGMTKKVRAAQKKLTRAGAHIGDYASECCL